MILRIGVTLVIIHKYYRIYIYIYIYLFIYYKIVIYKNVQTWTAAWSLAPMIFPDEEHFLGMYISTTSPASFCMTV